MEKNTKYGLIGRRLPYSFSKIVHEMIGKYSYSLIELEPEMLDEFFTKKEFLGVNVTIPYKVDVIKYLDFVDESAKKIGAVNTVVNKGGKLFGYNTDFYGLKATLERSSVSVKGKLCLILGTGATSNTANAVLKELGATNIIKVSRTKSQNAITYEEAVSKYNNAQIIVNTTPCGTFPNVKDTPMSLDNFNNLEGVFDVIYNPLCTNLTLAGAQKRAKTASGLYMLVYQAVKTCEFFLDTVIDKTKPDEIYEKILREKQNVVLTGMPTCGKSTIGKELAKKLGREFIDTDEEIVKFAKMEISEIFEKFGEKKFREIETKVISELSSSQGLVISTGGGAPLKEENVLALKRNGKIFFIDRDVDKLFASNDRPLSSDIEAVKKLYNARYSTYSATCDVKIDNNERVEDAIEKILKELNL